jgi:hypothetical protein
LTERSEGDADGGVSSFQFGNCADRGDEAANVIHDIVVKIA